jgi:hypothetical protein
MLTDKRLCTMLKEYSADTDMIIAHRVEFSKNDYNNVLREKRREFVNKHFGDTIDDAFEKLKKQANNMSHCHLEISFAVPFHFDIEKTETIISEYYRDLGYSILKEPRKGGSIITLTLT